MSTRVKELKIEFPGMFVSIACQCTCAPEQANLIVITLPRSQIYSTNRKSGSHLERHGGRGEKGLWMHGAALSYDVFFVRDTRKGKRMYFVRVLSNPDATAKGV